MHDKQSRESGFTLVEMLIVMVVLGILATIVIFGVGTLTSDSKTGACQANAKVMNIAEAAYAAQHPGSFAHGDTTKLAALIADPLPTSGAGAVKWDTSIGAWDCA